MALQLKYEVLWFQIDAQDPEVIARAHVRVTTYDDNGNVEKQRSLDIPQYTWAQLPANIRNDILALRDDMIAALKIKYGTTAVTMIPPQGG